MTTPRLAGSTFSFIWRETAIAAMRRMAAIGLNDFDVLLAPGHLWFDGSGANGPATLRRVLEAEGLRIESLNLPALDYNLCSVVPEVRERTVEAYASAILLAADLGARGVVVVPGRVSGLLAPRHEDSVGHLTDASARLVELARAHGSHLFFESHPQTPLPTADGLGAWVSQFDRRFASIAYDVANAEFIGEDQVAAIRRWGALIGQYHLSDATRTSWRHDAIGQGTVRFGPILEAMAAQDGGSAAILEIISTTPIEDMTAGMAALRR
ncbi:TIM barrel protein [Mesorhizobium sp. CAU 1732]|uniref:sugar phosphate isomerase/epimerase family protein n=1 Tax=Mesorhizobium sp. CAU 1732 TaxID=3140358 RepID=UPI003261BC5D